MKPEIEAYLRDNGARYTTEALRKQLIHAGYDPAEIDVALRETEAGRGPQLAEFRASRSRFRLSALAVHVAALVLVSIWVFSRNYTYAPIAVIILGLMLLVGLGISGLIGRAVLPRSGLTAALLVPVISAVGLSGVCLATIGGSSVSVPPRTGAMELKIKPPLSFDGSGTAQCYLQAGGFTVYAQDLGSLDGRSVSAQIATLGDPNAQASSSGLHRTVSLVINLVPRSGLGRETAYSGPGDVPFELDTPSDGLSGRLSFEGLAAQLFEGTYPSPGDPTPAPISGTVSWTCD